MIALGINNGWYDSGIQEKAYVDYAYNNTYRSLISKSDYQSYLNSYNSDCLPAIKKCQSSGTVEACQNADNTCSNDIEDPITESADFDVYDVRAGSNDPNPPSTYTSYLQQSSVTKAIGARSKYQDCPTGAYNKFSSTGDSKFSSSRAPLCFGFLFCDSRFSIQTD